MSIFAYVGKMGSGKSHTCVEQGVRWANQYQKPIVANFPLFLDALEEYCERHKLLWMARQCRRGNVYRDDDFARMTKYKKCTLLVDELGILLNKREVGANWNYYKKFILDLSMSRKEGQDMFWMTQHLSQVEQEILIHTNYYYKMNSFYDDFKLWVKYDAEGFQQVTKFPTFKVAMREKLDWKIQLFDQSLFKCYDTNHRFVSGVTYDPRDVAAELGVWNQDDGWVETDELVPGWRDGQRVMVPRVEWRPRPVVKAWHQQTTIPPSWNATPDPAPLPSPPGGRGRGGGPGRVERPGGQLSPMATIEPDQTGQPEVTDPMDWSAVEAAWEKQPDSKKLQVKAVLASLLIKK